MYAISKVVTYAGKVFGFMFEEEAKGNERFLKMKDAIKFVESREILNAVISYRNGIPFIKGRDCNLRQSVENITYNQAITKGVINSLNSRYFYGDTEGTDNLDTVEQATKHSKTVKHTSISASGYNNSKQISVKQVSNSQVSVNKGYSTNVFASLPPEASQKSEKLKELFNRYKILILNVRVRNEFKSYTLTVDTGLIRELLNVKFNQENYNSINETKLNSIDFFSKIVLVALDIKAGRFIKIPLSCIEGFSEYFSLENVNSIYSSVEVNKELESNRVCLIIYLTKNGKTKRVFSSLNSLVLNTLAEKDNINKARSKNKDESLVVTYDLLAKDLRALYVKRIIKIIPSTDNNLSLDIVDNLLKTKRRLSIEYIFDGDVRIEHCSIQPDYFKHTGKTVYDFINEYKKNKDNKSFLVYSLGAEKFLKIPYNRIVSIKFFNENVELLKNKEKMKYRTSR